MSWQKILIAAGGAAAAGAVLYFLLRDEAEAAGGASGDGDEKRPKRTGEVTKEQVQQILAEIVRSQDSMRGQMKLLFKEMRARPLSFEETYERVKSVQPDDPLERNGLSMDEFDEMLSRYQTDPQVKEGIQRIMGGPGAGGEESGEMTAFTVTINKTSKLGLTSVTGPNGGRRIMDVTSGGLVDNHNRANPNDKICVFDEIVDVNGVTGADPMSEELVQNKVMVMKILRRAEDSAAKDVDVQTLVKVHYAMLEELESIVKRFMQDPKNKATHDMKTVTLAAQAVVGAKVEERWGLTSEDIERAVITHHAELATNREFASINVGMQKCMQALLEP